MLYFQIFIILEILSRFNMIVKAVEIRKTKRCLVSTEINVANKLKK